MQRNINKIIELIKKQIPKDKTEFFKDLDWVINDANYRPPENQSTSWRHLSSCASRHCPYPPQEEWHWNIASILSTKSVEELKKIYFEKNTK